MGVNDIRTSSAIAIVVVAGLLLWTTADTAHVSSFGTAPVTSKASSASASASASSRRGRLPFLLSDAIYRTGRGGGSGRHQGQDSTTTAAAAAKATSTSLASTVVPPSSSPAESSTSSSNPVDEDNLALLSERGRDALLRLIEFDADLGAQRHVYADWPECGTDDEGKKRLADQVSIS